MQQKINPVIMAGGNGTRLWPLSINSKPKQFLKVDSGFSPLQQTIIRNSIFGKPTIIVNHKHKNIALKQVAELGIECEMIVEPQGQGTAICSIIASIATKEKGSNCVMLIPSDHKIQDNYGYAQTILRAASFINQANIVTIGIKPDKFSAKYGYIKQGDKIEDGVYTATKFVEKPASSNNYFDQKSFFWNSGIFLYNPDKFLLAIQNSHKKLLELSLSIWQSRVLLKKNYICLDEDKYSQIKDFGSIDQEFMEQMKEVLMVEGRFDWLDIGDFTTFFDVISKDLNSNYLSGNTFANNVKNCCVIHDKKVTVIIGMQDTIVVSNKQYLLIASKEKIKDLESSLKNLRMQH